MQLFADWVKEVHDQETPNTPIDATLQHAVRNMGEFAQKLRKLDWQVYHYKERDELKKMIEIGLYRKAGHEWGLIVAPYCDRLTAWRLGQ